MTRWVQVEKMEDPERPRANPVVELRLDCIESVELGMDAYGEFALFHPAPVETLRAAAPMAQVLPWLLLGTQAITNMTRDAAAGAPIQALPKTAAQPHRRFIVLPALADSHKDAIATAVQADAVAGFEYPNGASFGATIYLRDGRDAFVTAPIEKLRAALASPPAQQPIVNLTDIGLFGPPLAPPLHGGGGGFARKPVSPPLTP